MAADLNPQPPDTAAALEAALPTRRHAELCFDLAVDLLGEDAWVETRAMGNKRMLFRRDPAHPHTYCPSPVLVLGVGGRLGFVFPAGEPTWEEQQQLQLPPEPEGPAPRLAGLGPGSIEIRDGPRHVTVTYGESGRAAETSRDGPPDVLPEVAGLLAAGGEMPAEIVARFVATRDPGRHGGGRVFLPVPTPYGVPGAWAIARRALRLACFGGRVPADAAWLVADGFAGTAIAWGGARDEALAAWRREVERIAPRPPTPPETPPPPSAHPAGHLEMEQVTTAEGFAMQIRMRGPSSDVAPVEPTPDNTPAAILELPPWPKEPPAVGTWIRLVGDLGRVAYAALRRDEEGFLLVGEAVVPWVDLLDLDAELDRIDEALRQRGDSLREQGALAAYDTETTIYRFVDPETGAPQKPSRGAASLTTGFHPDALDADRLAGCVLRARLLSSS